MLYQKLDTTAFCSSTVDSINYSVMFEHTISIIPSGEWMSSNNPVLSAGLLKRLTQKAGLGDSSQYIELLHTINLNKENLRFGFCQRKKKRNYSKWQWDAVYLHLLEIWESWEFYIFNLMIL